MNSQRLELGDLFRLADQFHDSAVLHFAHAGGLFELTAAELTADEVADRLGWVPRKAVILLDALVALRLLTKDSADRYRNAPATDEFLVRSSAGYVGGVVDHQRLQWENWARIGDVMTTDAALPFQQDERLDRDASANTAFHEAMRHLARFNVPAFLALPEADGRRHIVDLAGGHGTYLAALAAANPGITGEVWDRPGAERSALDTFAEYGCADRCRFLTRDITDLTWYEGDRCDVVMLNDCLHYFEKSTVLTVLSCANKMLRKGGSLIVATRVLDDGAVTPATAAGFSLHMMMNTRYGGLHVTSWVRGALSNLGLSVTDHPLDPIGRYVILRGVQTG